MQRFIALVLTYDRNHILTQHMVQSYQRLWPDHPFNFRVPFQKWPEELAKRLGEIATFIQAPASIKQTALTLLEGIDDQDWVYWCIDDKYLVDLDARKATQVAKWVSEIRDPLICGVSFARSRRMLQNEYLFVAQTISDGRGSKYIRRIDYSQIWLHQFLRAKVLRKLFNGFPDGGFPAKAMDAIKERMALPPDQQLYVSKTNHVVFGESTTRGKLTANCALSLKTYGISLPGDIERSEAQIIIGDIEARTRQITS